MTCCFSLACRLCLVRNVPNCTVAFCVYRRTGTERSGAVRATCFRVTSTSLALFVPLGLAAVSWIRCATTHPFFLRRFRQAFATCHDGIFFSRTVLYNEAYTRPKIVKITVIAAERHVERDNIVREISTFFPQIRRGILIESKSVMKFITSCF